MVTIEELQTKLAAVEAERDELRSELQGVFLELGEPEDQRSLDVHVFELQQRCKSARSELAEVRKAAESNRRRAWRQYAIAAIRSGKNSLEAVGLAESVIRAEMTTFGEEDE